MQILEAFVEQPDVKGVLRLMGYELDWRDAKARIHICNAAEGVHLTEQGPPHA